MHSTAMYVKRFSHFFAVESRLEPKKAGLRLRCTEPTDHRQLAAPRLWAAAQRA